MRVRRSDRLRPPAIWRFVVHGVVLGALSGVLVAAAVTVAFVVGLALVGVAGDAPVRPAQGAVSGLVAGSIGGGGLASVLLPYRRTGPTLLVRAVAAGWAAATATVAGVVLLVRAGEATVDGTTVLLVAAAALAAAVWWQLSPLLWWTARRPSAVAPPSERPRRSDRHVRR